MLDLCATHFCVYHDTIGKQKKRIVEVKFQAIEGAAVTFSKKKICKNIKILSLIITPLLQRHVYEIISVVFFLS